MGYVESGEIPIMGPITAQKTIPLISSNGGSPLISISHVVPYEVCLRWLNQSGIVFPGNEIPPPK
jgi:hypothetical protein